MVPPPSIRSPWMTPLRSPWRDAFRRWWYHRSPPRDPFLRVESQVDWSELVPEAAGDFRRYLQGTSRVQVANLEEVCRWLLACRYVTDQHSMNRDDHWQHPLEFEQRRWGDCEDHALWAWRKLADLGVPAEFVVGLWNPAPHDLLVNHAWLHVQQDGGLLLIETTATGRRAMSRSVTTELTEYVPTASIDHRLRSYYFANYFHVRLYGRNLGRTSVSSAA